MAVLHPLQIITSEEAERRGQVYDRQGATYLFDLDYVEDVYTVDAAHYGNISHFVNHSVSGAGSPYPNLRGRGLHLTPPHPRSATPTCRSTTSSLRTWTNACPASPSSPPAPSAPGRSSPLTTTCMVGTHGLGRPPPHPATLGPRPRGVPPSPGTWGGGGAWHSVLGLIWVYVGVPRCSGLAWVHRCPEVHPSPTAQPPTPQGLPLPRAAAVRTAGGSWNLTLLLLPSFSPQWTQ